MLLLCFLYLMFALVLPRLYKVYVDGMTGISASFLIFYTYPLWDLIFYFLTLFLGTKID